MGVLNEEQFEYHALKLLHTTTPFEWVINGNDIEAYGWDEDGERTKILLFPYPDHNHMMVGLLELIEVEARTAQDEYKSDYRYWTKEIRDGLYQSS